MYYYAVIGNPIEHSKSPQIHSVFAQQENIDINYQRILAEESNFNRTVNDFFTRGGLGLNITVPFKMKAYQQCSHVDDYAKAAKAVNTVSRNETGEWLGANTDGIGLLRDLQDNLGISIKNKSILILGAGGASRGILLPLLNSHPSHIVIANRTIAKALELADAFKDILSVQGCGYETIPNNSYEIVINATSASLDDALPPIPDKIISANSICYDLAYSDQPTAFLRWARRHGARQTHDGIGMLIEQAAESYYIWRGYKPNTKQVFELLRPNLCK